MVATAFAWANRHFVILSVVLVVAGACFAAGQSYADYPRNGDYFAKADWRWKLTGRLGEYAIGAPVLVVVVGGLVLAVLDKLGV